MNSLIRDVTQYLVCLFASPPRPSLCPNTDPHFDQCDTGCAILLLMIVLSPTHFSSEADAFCWISLLTRISFGVAPVLAFLVIGLCLIIKISSWWKIISRPVSSGNLSQDLWVGCVLLGLWGSAMIRFLILAGYFWGSLCTCNYLVSSVIHQLTLFLLDCSMFLSFV